MRLLEELERVTEILERYPGQWAICGGVAASIYRASPRFTGDIDFALVDSHAIAAEELASEVAKKLGHKEYRGFVPDPLQENRQLYALVSARGLDDERFVGFDFLLPVQPWIPHAVELAQNNRIDYGFALLPTVTPESLIVAKLIALNGSTERHQDRDDILQILKANPISVDFIREEIADCGITLKADLKELIDRMAAG